MPRTAVRRFESAYHAALVPTRPTAPPRRLAAARAGLVGLALLCLWTLVSSPEAQGKSELPTDLTHTKAAELAIEAFDGDEQEMFQELADLARPDPWRVVRTILGAARYDVAARWVEVVGAPRHGGMAKEVAAWKANPEPPEIEALFLRAEAAIASGTIVELRATLAALRPPTASGRILQLYYRGVAASRAKDLEAHRALLAEQTTTAAAAGWHEQESFASWAGGFYPRNAGRWAEAAKAFRRSLKAARLAQSPFRKGVAATHLALALLRLRKFDATLAMAEEARRLQTLLKDPSEVGRLWHITRQVHLYRGDHAAALDAGYQAATVYADAGDTRMHVQTLSTIGSSLKNLGRLAEARKVLEDAMQRAQDPAAARYIPDVERQLGHVYLRQGEVARSIALYKSSLAAVEKRGDKKRIAWALHALGSAYSRIGDADAAIEVLERAIAIKTKRGDEHGLGRTLGVLANVYQGAKRYEQALKVYERSLTLKRKLEDKPGIAYSLINMSETLRLLGQVERAEQGLTEAIKLKREMKDIVGVAIGRSNLANLYATTGKPERAIPILEQTIAQATEQGLLLVLAATHLGLSRALHLTGDHKGAMAQAEKAIELKWMLGAGLDTAQAEQIRARHGNVARFGLQAALELGDVGRVFRYLEVNRAEALLESLGGRDALGATALPDDLAEAERTAHEAVRLAQQELILALGSGDDARRRRTQLLLDAARARLKQIVTRIKTSAPKTANVIYPEPLPLADAQEALGTDSVLVMYELDGPDAMALVVTRSQARVVTLGPTTAITEAIQRLKLDAPPLVPTPAIDALRKLVVDPLKLTRLVRRVLIAPSGALASVPFAVFLPHHELGYIPSMTSYALLSKGCTRCGTGVLAVGDPEYPLPQGDAPHAGLRRLPHTRKEATSIGEVVLVGTDATEPKLVHALAQRGAWSAVHLACHALMNDEDPRRSALALTPSPQNDGRLTVRDVLRMQVPADLVVLSACETGMRTVRSAEGITGFTRAFMFAGAPRVLVSAWMVDDAATSALMTKFYELWKTEGDETPVSTAHALRQAQAWMRSQEQWKHPYYWAAWSLWGVPE